jgi:hypothetical protein
MERLASWYLLDWDAWRAEGLGHMKEVGDDTKAVDAYRDEGTTTTITESRVIGLLLFIRHCEAFIASRISPATVG